MNRVLFTMLQMKKKSMRNIENKFLKHCVWSWKWVDNWIRIIKCESWKKFKIKWNKIKNWNKNKIKEDTTIGWSRHYNLLYFSRVDVTSFFLHIIIIMLVVVVVMIICHPFPFLDLKKRIKSKHNPIF